MASGGGPPTSPSSSHARIQSVRESRFLGQGYADITKLREIAAKHERLSSKNQQRAARIHTKIEKLRHSSTVLREKAQMVLGQIPEIESMMAQYERDIKAANDRTDGIVIGSDVTNLQYRIRKLQQKVVDLQHKSRTLEHRAAQRTQKSAELKVKADRYLEQARIAEQEAESYRQRADRLQLATQEEAPGLGSAPPAGAHPPPSL
jgi:peptidoglycan hydrolase CwlO-like protein